VAVTLALFASIDTGHPIVGALIFPFGLTLVVLLGGELLTGSFAVTPCAAFAGKVTWGRVITNWGWVALGNFLGCVAYGYLIMVSLTMDGTAQQLHPVAAKLVKMAEAKVNGYAAIGGSGIYTVLVKGFLCNWMVSLGVVVAFTSQSAIGKMFALWGPVVLFFAQGWEHTVVNAFVIPTGMMLGANFAISDWWIYNQIPATVGNLIGAFVCNTMALYLTHRPAQTATEAAVAQLAPQMAQPGQIGR
jgi:formate/nitrite transporter